jgi:cytochrome b
VKVWDLLSRATHWLLVAGVAAAWLTRAGWGKWHEWIGYATLAFVALRVAWGWLGPRYAHFSQFVRSPSATLAYARQAVAGREPRHIGHNPLGGWMIVALLAATALAAGSGWLYVTDAYWGEERAENLHEALAITLLALVALHVIGVVTASIRHRENLVASMIHGRKRPPAADDVA